MTENGIYQVLLFLAVIILLVKPLGWYIARVYEGKSCGLNYILSPLEKLIYKLCDISVKKEMEWKEYLSCMLFFNLLGLLAVYALLRLQTYLPLNPQAFPAVSPMLAFNTAVSFVTNTDWQAYAGENTLSYFSQMAAITVQNFLSAATGLALLIALIRGIARTETKELGNFWVDLVRGVLYIFLPLALLLSVTLTSQGVIQNFKPYEKINLLQPITYNDIISTQQIIPMGPVASQVAIKQLGTNGGGFFNANSAHPFENPNPLTNFLELLAILLIPAALCYSFGMMIKDKRQGWAIFIAMLILFVPAVLFCMSAEQAGNPALFHLNIDQAHQSLLSPGGNMEGKETRFGINNSAIWAAATSATSNGSVNAMLDSFTPLGGLVPLWLMHLGEVVFGGVGSGFYGILMLVILTVFVAGLMVGRTPEYLGKKIEIYEIKMASITVLLMPMTVLILTAISVITKMGTDSIFNPGAHGFTEILYAFTSLGNNNGSAFSGLNTASPLYNIVGGIEMLMMRFWIAIPVLAIAGSLANKKKIPNNLGTLPTHTPLFIGLLICIILILGALTFLPALALGPIVEHLTLWGQYGH